MGDGYGTISYDINREQRGVFSTPGENTEGLPQKVLVKVCYQMMKVLFPPPRMVIVLAFYV